LLDRDEAVSDFEVKDAFRGWLGRRTRPTRRFQRRRRSKIGWATVGLLRRDQKVRKARKGLRTNNLSSDRRCKQEGTKKYIFKRMIISIFVH
jgi:hypothetical protein